MVLPKPAAVRGPPVLGNMEVCETGCRGIWLLGRQV